MPAAKFFGLNPVKLNYFWKYFLSFVLILLIPTLLLSLLNFNFIRSYYSKQLVQKKQIELDNCGNTLSLLMVQINNSIAEYRNSKYFFSFPDGDNSLDYFFGVRDQLMSGMLVNKYLSDIVFYSEKRNSVQTSSDITSLDKFSSGLFGFSDPAEFKNALSAVTVPVFLRSGNSKPMFVTPFQRDNAGVYFSYIIYILDDQMIDNILAPILYMDNYRFSAEYNNSSFIEKEKNSAGPGVTIRYADRGSLTLELFFPQSYINSEVRPLVNSAVLIISVIIFLSFIVIIILTNRNYKPIRRLFNRAKPLVAGSAETLNEFEAAENALNNLVSDRNELMEFNRKLQRDRILLKLISRRAVIDSCFEDECNNAGLVFNRKYYICYIIGLTGPDFSLTGFIEDTKKKAACEIYALDLDNPDNLVLIVCADTITEPQDFFNGCDSNSLVVKGRGKAVDAPGKISLSYNSARHNTGKQPGDSGEVYPADDLNTLKNAVLACDEDKILFACENITNSIQDCDNFFFACCVYADLLRTSYDALSDLNMEFSADINSFYTAKFNTADEIINCMQDTVELILKTIKQQNYESKILNKNVKDVTSFINENYLDRNFTVKSMASFFNVTVSNLSHYYKQQTGRTLSDYIIGLKMEHAKKLLRTTNMNLSAVTAASGYTEISAFIKVFKKTAGMTPGEYRKQPDQAF
ncbi:MAG: AraC family transcriptional regulator [Treponema sp.]|nr:AraC family transcriptional regulator [Treponema sp.]